VITHTIFLPLTVAFVTSRSNNRHHSAFSLHVLLKTTELGNDAMSFGVRKLEREEGEGLCDGKKELEVDI
jgi:hypothetical protein